MTGAQATGGEDSSVATEPTMPPALDLEVTSSASFATTPYCRDAGASTVGESMTANQVVVGTGVSSSPSSSSSSAFSGLPTPTLGVRSSSNPAPEHDYSAMPLFRGLVKRSTRFTTTVPATQVLRLINEIIEANPNSLPSPPPRRKTADSSRMAQHEATNALDAPRHRVSVDYETYQLECLSMEGDTRLCRVHIFLMKAGLYMVEFIRDQLDIFQFKRFYESIRAKLSDIVKKDHTLQLLAARPYAYGTGGRRARISGPLSMGSAGTRKRSHSF